jgi:hypothetical protein
MSDRPIAKKARSVESAAIAGIVYAVLAFTALTLLTRLPSLSLSSDEIAAWYRDAGNRAPVVLGLNLAAISSIAFLWFVAVIRRRIGDREDRFFATVFLGSGIFYVATWLVAASLLAAAAVAPDLFAGAAADKASHTLAAGSAGGLLLVAGPRVQAVFVLTTSTLILRTKVMPRWLAFFGYALGLALFVTPLIIQPIGLGFPAWVLVVSVTILFSRSAASPVDETPGLQSD